MARLATNAPQPWNTWETEQVPTVVDGAKAPLALPGNLFWFQSSGPTGKSQWFLCVGTRTPTPPRGLNYDKSFAIFRDKSTGVVFIDDEGIEWEDPSGQVDVMGVGFTKSV